MELSVHLTLICHLHAFVFVVCWEVRTTDIVKLSLANTDFVHFNTPCYIIRTAQCMLSPERERERGI